MKSFKKTWLVWILAIALLIPGGLVSAMQIDADSTEPVVEAEDLDIAAQQRSLKYVDEFTGTETVPEEQITEDPFELPETLRVIVRLTDQPVVDDNPGYTIMNGEDAERTQAEVMTAMTRLGIDYEYHTAFTALLNGFSVTVKTEDIEKIKEIPEVISVNPVNYYNRPEPLMAETVHTVHAPELWRVGFKGEGMVVAVIDSGFDVTHKDMVLSDPSTGRLTKEFVDSLGMEGTYATPKFPYIYNYYDEDTDVLEDGASHGQHVSGTIAANGGPGGVTGIAPEAQIIGLRVFARDPLFSTTTSDLYIKALDDAIKLGADAANLSLGFGAAFIDFEPIDMDLAIERARKTGMTVAIAAGNDHNNVYGATKWTKQPGARKDFPDVGVMSAPAITKDCIAVAAADKYNPYERTMITTLVPREDTGEPELHKWKYQQISGTPDMYEKFGDAEVPYVYGGYGSPEEIAAAGTEGKVCVIQRGNQIAFTDKYDAAQAAGATAVVLYNNESDDMVNPPVPENPTIPMIFTGVTMGTVLKDNPNKMLKLQVDLNSAPDAEMAAYSTWGATNNLELKPEITAPGSDIRSTAAGNQYATMSGTSMATPHVAGGIALFKQYMNGDAKYADLADYDKAFMAKIVLMNTAHVLTALEPGKPAPVARSPRVQGAGLMDLQNAIDANAYVVATKTGEPKVELKEIRKTNFGIALEVKNLSDKTINYDVETILLTDSINKDGFYTEYSRDVAHTNNGDKTATVEPKGMTYVNLSIDFSAADIEEEQFLEGFVVLKGDDGVTLSVPFMGFYGDWQKPEALDYMIANEEAGADPHGETYLNFAGLLYTTMQYFDPAHPEFGGFPSYHFHKNQRIEMNPSNPISEKTGKYQVIPHLTFMRSLEDLAFRILDQDDNVVHTVSEFEWVKKMFQIYRGMPHAQTVHGGSYRGNLINGMLPEGLYKYQIAYRLNYEDAVEHSRTYPLLIDETAPVVEDFNYTENSKRATFTVTDPGYPETGVGVGKIVITNTLDPEEKGVEVEPNESGNYDVEIGELVANARRNNTNRLYIYVADKLLNATTQIVKYETYEPEDSELNIFMYDPAPTGVSPYSKIPVNAMLWGWEHLDKINIYLDGEIAIEITEPLRDKIEVPNPAAPWEMLYKGDGYVVENTFLENVSNGRHKVKLEAVHDSGVTESITRYITVNATPPVLDVAVKERAKDSPKATLVINAFEDVSGLVIFINGVPVKNLQYESPGELKDFEFEVDLDWGENTFLVEAINSGTTTIRETNETINIAQQEIVIIREKADEPVEPDEPDQPDEPDKPKLNGWHVIGGDVYYFEDGVPATGYTKINKTMYLFDKDGKQQRGWHVVGGKQMYFNEKNGGQLTGKRTIGNTTYLLGSDGGKLFGWHVLRGKKYYFDPDFGGGMVTGLRTAGGTAKYFFRIKESAAGANDRGSAVVNETIIINGREYTFNANGILVNIAP